MEENRRDAAELAQIFRALDELDKPVVARVQGAALGGGTGLVAACDVVVAAEGAVFGTTEVRLGIVPAVISPYLVRKIGESHARSLVPDGRARRRRGGAARRPRPPRRAGEGPGRRLAGGRSRRSSSAGPAAVAEAKRLVRTVSTLPAREASAWAIQRMAERRGSAGGDGGPEGLPREAPRELDDEGIVTRARPFRRVLVANRGEIAVRVLRGVPRGGPRIGRRLLRGRRRRPARRARGRRGRDRAGARAESRTCRSRSSSRAREGEGLRRRAPRLRLPLRERGASRAPSRRPASSGSAPRPRRWRRWGEDRVARADEGGGRSRRSGRSSTAPKSTRRFP